MTSAVLVSFGVIFLAELGDKSQLMALTFALRYRWWVVLGGIATAVAATQLLAVAAGHYAAATIPAGVTALVSGLAFLAVGWWGLRGDADSGALPRSSRPAFVAVVSAFLLAELGDRTMFATLTLAGRYGWLGVWAGSALAMVAACGLAVAVGLLAGRRFPLHTLQLASSLLFVGLGAWTLFELVTGPLWATFGAGAAVATVAVWQRRARTPAVSAQPAPATVARQP